MIEKEIVIGNPTGLHTRPANRFVKEAKKYESDIILKKDQKEANGKSLLKIMKMGISQGDRITMVFEGPDEQSACEGLVSLLQSLEE